MEGYPESGWQRIVRERSRQAQVDPRQAARSGSVATARDKEAPLGAISPITRSWSTSEVERPIPVSSWDGRFRVPIRSVPDWIVVCASEAPLLPGSEDRPHADRLLACFVVLLGEHVDHGSRFRPLRAVHAPSLDEHLLSLRSAASVRSTPPFGGCGRSVRPGGGPASSQPKCGARLEPLRPRTP